MNLNWTDYLFFAFIGAIIDAGEARKNGEG